MDGRLDGWLRPDSRRIPFIQSSNHPVFRLIGHVVLLKSGVSMGGGRGGHTAAAAFAAAAAQCPDPVQHDPVSETGPETIRHKTGSDYYELLSRNKEAFLFATDEEMPEMTARGGGRDSAAQLLRILKAVMKDRRQLTEDQEAYVKKVMLRLEEGALPKQTAKEALKSLNELKDGLTNPLKVLGVLQTSISARLLEEHFAAGTGARTGRREVILSLYLTK